MEANLFAVFRRFLEQSREHLPEIGYTRDISGNSIFFFTRGKIERGDDILISIHGAFDWAEAKNPPMLEGKGKIVRIERILQTFPPGEVNGVAVALEEELAVCF